MVFLSRFERNAKIFAQFCAKCCVAKLCISWSKQAFTEKITFTTSRPRSTKMFHHRSNHSLFERIYPQKFTQRSILVIPEYLNLSSILYIINFHRNQKQMIRKLVFLELEWLSFWKWKLCNIALRARKGMNNGRSFSKGITRNNININNTKIWFLSPYYESFCFLENISSQ